MSHEQDERRYSIDCREGKPLTSETGQYACQQNPSRKKKKKKKKEGKENREQSRNPGQRFLSDVLEPTDGIHFC